jgi:hypothetical protein
MSVPPDDPLRRVADFPPPADQTAAVRALVEAGKPVDRAGTELKIESEADAGSWALLWAGPDAEALRPYPHTGVPAGQAIGARFGAMLGHVFTDEPPVADAVNEVFRRVAAARRRRARLVLAAGSAAVVIVALLGYAMTTVLLPASPTQSPAAETVQRPPAADPLLALLTPMLAASGLTVVPHQPSRGNGWRQYLVRERGGRPRGLLEISVYAAPGPLCLPVLADKSACARPERAAGGVQYARYAFDRNIDWQVNEAMAHRGPRMVVVQATGERGSGNAQAGRPSLAGMMAAAVAVDPRTAAAFGAHEVCTAACPVLKVPVPIAQ